MMIYPPANQHKPHFSNLLRFVFLFIFLVVTACAGKESSTEPIKIDDAVIETANPVISVEADLAEQIVTWEEENIQKLPTEVSTVIVPDSAAVQPTIDVLITWQEAPVIPSVISDRAIEIYLAGLAKGRRPNVFGKVGDCGSTPSWFLGSFDLSEEYYSLGEYTYLESVINQYVGSFKRTSVAAVPGFNTSSVFAPLWADPVQCNPDEGPIACEYRIQEPSVALIMLGTNDQYRPDEFEEKMREIIEFSIENGVLPILVSKADNLEGDHRINQIIFELAVEYELPFWNYWSAVQALPNQGMQEDGAHLTWAPNFFDDPRAMQTAWTIRNLTALQVLDAVWKALPTP